jgi:hypothetical protein
MTGSECTSGFKFKLGHQNEGKTAMLSLRRVTNWAVMVDEYYALDL